MCRGSKNMVRNQALVLMDDARLWRYSLMALMQTCVIKNPAFSNHLCLIMDSLDELNEANAAFFLSFGCGGGSNERVFKDSFFTFFTFTVSSVPHSPFFNPSGI